MRKKQSPLPVFSILVAFFFIPLFPQEEDLLFEKSIQEKIPSQRLQKLETYYFNQKEKGNPVNKNFYPQIIITARLLQRYDKVIQYGEPALKLFWNNESLKWQIYYYTAEAYYNLNFNQTKALDYTEAIIQALQGNLSEQAGLNANHENPEPVIISTLKLQLKIYRQLNLSQSEAQAALQKSLFLFLMDSESESLQKEVFYFSRILFQDFHETSKSLAAMERLGNTDSPNVYYLNILALWYSQLNQNQKAAGYLKQSLAIKKEAGVAYSLGKILQEIDLDQAIQYLAQAHLMDDPRISPQAKALLDHLYFNVKTKDMPPSDQENGYQKLMAETRKKIMAPSGKKDPQ